MLKEHWNILQSGVEFFESLRFQTQKEINLLPYKIELKKCVEMDKKDKNFIAWTSQCFEKVMKL